MTRHLGRRRCGRGSPSRLLLWQAAFARRRFGGDCFGGDRDRAATLVTRRFGHRSGRRRFGATALSGDAPVWVRPRRTSPIGEKPFRAPRFRATVPCGDAPVWERARRISALVSLSSGEDAR
ncbi:hypothetical protein [Kibdelosporangium philippinense]|uniref:hypothetical protein n=1 Tax=Kibdelosporangium philippinense TaxID=211113 RepID=UPI0036132750